MFALEFYAACLWFSFYHTSTAALLTIMLSILADVPKSDICIIAHNIGYVSTSERIAVLHPFNKSQWKSWFLHSGLHGSFENCYHHGYTAALTRQQPINKWFVLECITQRYSAMKTNSKNRFEMLLSGYMGHTAWQIHTELIFQRATLRKQK